MAVTWREIVYKVDTKLPAVEVDHGASSPVALGAAPATSAILMLVICTEAPAVSPNTPALTLGDEDDADSHFTYAMLPTVINESSLGPLYYYPASKALRAVITTAGTAGKWKVLPIIIKVE